jgi:hypothetical protein
VAPGCVSIEGRVDLHVHFGPDFARPGKTVKASVTAIQAAIEAAHAGYAAIVLKSHDFGSQSLALAVEEVVPGIRVFGGVALDHTVGGLNPIAVEQTLLLGGKIVWLPTKSGMQDFSSGVSARHGFDRPGIPVVDDEGEVLPVVREIFDLVEENDAILATGHITAAEHYAIARAFGRSGRVLVTHAGEEASGPSLDKQACVELADLGAVIELSAQTSIPHFGFPGRTTRGLAEMIRAVGPERCVLATDFGWNDELPRPVPGMQSFLDALFIEGIRADDLRLMVSDHPARLLGLGW